MSRRDSGAPLFSSGAQPNRGQIGRNDHKAWGYGSANYSHPNEPPPYQSPLQKAKYFIRRYSSKPGMKRDKSGLGIFGGNG